MEKGEMSRRSFLSAVAWSALALAGCGSMQGDEGAGEAAHRVEMVTNVGGINDQGFCQLSWAGLQRLRDEQGYEVSYIESKQDSDYASNLDKAIDYGAEFVWAIGFAMSDAVAFTAKINPDVNVGFGIVDANTSGAPNLTGVLFAAQEPSFVVGYIAGRCTKTNRVGFVGGISSDNIYAFEYGYVAGVTYAARELGHEITVDRQYAESFTDSAKGKSIAQKMFVAGADIVYHAAGGTGVGVIEAAQETDNFAIGVDLDQSYLAPNNVLTSAIKRVDQALVDLTPKLISGELAGGTDVILTLADGEYMGIPQNHEHMPEEVYQDALAVIEKIRTGEIVVPANEAEYETYLAQG
ncbi:MAG: BMP family ABC transporter substrate-binding protein [Coriobacteriales bacterium]|nr:BMP family ABC transporter substrate-binding protein [Coriobacteriales bacterium]